MCGKIKKELIRKCDNQNGKLKNKQTVCETKKKVGDLKKKLESKCQKAGVAKDQEGVIGRRKVRRSAKRSESEKEVAWVR